MTGHEIAALVLATGVVAFGLGYICRDWEQWAIERADREAERDRDALLNVVTNDGCLPEHHEVGVHSPGHQPPTVPAQRMGGDLA